MRPTLKLAVSQFPLTGDIAANASYVAEHMEKAATHGVQVVHFPEGALSGYASSNFASFDRYDWPSLEHHTGRICALASTLNLWVVLGSARMTTAHPTPLNCLYVISPAGVVVATYDKRKLYKRERDVYCAGTAPLVLSIRGVTCVFLVCYDSCFPELYQEYADREVQLLFHSYYNAKNEGAATSLDDLILAQLRTRAADHHLWISASNSSAWHSRLASCVARPDGSIRGAKRHVPGLFIHDFPDHDLGWTYPCGES